MPINNISKAQRLNKGLKISLSDVKVATEGNMKCPKNHVNGASSMLWHIQHIICCICI